jgi:hypothetical protein
MPTRPMLRAIVLGALLLTAAGCGSNTATPQAGSSPARPSPASQRPSAASPGPTASPTITPGGPLASKTPGSNCTSHPAPGPVTMITLRNSSNGGTFCISLGQRVIVQLDSKPSRMWSAIRSDSKALVRVSYGNLMLRVGETGASFAAVQRGIAHLSSARPVCASGPVHCDALMAFQVTVMIGGIEGSPAH